MQKFEEVVVAVVSALRFRIAPWNSETKNAKQDDKNDKFSARLARKPYFVGSALRTVVFSAIGQQIE